MLWELSGVFQQRIEELLWFIILTIIIVVVIIMIMMIIFVIMMMIIISIAVTITTIINVIIIIIIILFCEICLTGLASWREHRDFSSFCSPVIGFIGRAEQRLAATRVRGRNCQIIAEMTGLNENSAECGRIQNLHKALSTKRFLTFTPLILDMKYPTYKHETIRRHLQPSGSEWPQPQMAHHAANGDAAVAARGHNTAPMIAAELPISTKASHRIVVKA